MPVNRAALDSILKTAEALGAREDWKVRTVAGDITFNKKNGSEDLPVLTVDTPTYKDPNPKDVAAPLAQQLKAAKTLADVKAIVTAQLLAEKDYFAATGEKTSGQNETFGIQELRRNDFFGAVFSMLSRSRIKGLEGALVELKESLILGRGFQMELGSHDNYWPYWQNYVGVLEKMIAQLSPSHPAYAALKARIEIIYNRKTAGGQSIDESNVEQSMRMAVVYRPIGSKDKGHRVSLTANSRPDAPEYEVLNVQKRGLPASEKQHAGKAVVRDGAGALTFDLDGAPVPAALAKYIESKAVQAQDCGLRPLLPSEQARAGIAYDWDRSGDIAPGDIDISWWGHCHNEAPLNALGVDPKYSLQWYKAGVKDAQALQAFSASDVWDITGNLMADREGGFARTSGGGWVDLDNTTFVGDRNNGSHELALTVGSRQLRLDFEVQDWVENGVDLDLKAFRTNLESTDGKTFAPNPATKNVNGDIVTLEGKGQQIAGVVKFIDLDDQGYRTEVKDYVELDPTQDKFVKVGANIVSLPGRGRDGEVEEYEINAKTQEVRTTRVKVSLDASGQATRTPSTPSQPQKVSSMAFRQETPFDSVKEIHAFCTDKIGMPFVFDTSPDMAVWNYPVNFLKIDQVSREEKPDGVYTRYALSYTTMGGPSGNVEYILKRNAEGEVIDAIACGPMPDFAFRHDRVEMAAISVGADGKPVYNAGAAQGGYLFDGNDPTPGLELYERQLKVLYASLSAKQDSYIFEDDDQKLYRFTDKAQFDAAIAAREAIV